MHSLVPHGIRQALRRWSHARDIKAGRFGDVSDPLFRRMREWISEGDWVIDVGAAVGDYSLALSNLVGANGRVIAFEPMHAQFEILASNTALAPYPNITCLQVAAGEVTDMCHMVAPDGNHGPNWYEAAVCEGNGVPVIRVAIDDLPIQRRVSFIKLDAEGHDLSVLRGASEMIKRDRPTLLVESHHPDLVEWLSVRGYHRAIAEPDSTNRVYIFGPSSTSQDSE